MAGASPEPIRGEEPIIVDRPLGIRLIHLLAALAFVGAVEGQAYGLRPCPVHDSLPGTADDHHVPGTAGAAGAAHPGPDAAASDHGAEHAAHHTAATAPHDHHGGGGPCTCIHDCNVGTGTVALPDETVVAAGQLPPLVLGSMVDGASLRGPRHQLFELHLPNAPPA